MITRLTLGFALFFGQPVFAGDAHSHHHPSGEMNRERPSAVLGESVYNARASWTDQNGKSRKLAELRGKNVVAAMLYTSCKAACPLTLVDLRNIEKGLDEAARKHVHFAIFSFDSGRDDPAKLAAFMKKQELDPTRWSFFHGSPGAVRELAAILGVRFKKDAQGEFDHSNVITVLDSDGLIRRQQVGLRADSKETIELLSKGMH